MKLLLAVTALFASHTVALQPGDICQSNWECARDCFLARWTLGYQNDGYVFECDSTAIDAQRFYVANCRISMAQGGTMLNKDATTNACATVGGTSCQIGCLISGKESTEARTRSDFTGACKTTKAGAKVLDAYFRKYDIEAKAKADALCPEASNAT
jgi:hypothetical protein